MLSRRRALAAYTALALLRVLVAFTSPSFIHPDEHFQNPEVAASLSFTYAATGDPPLRTWEWRPPSPCRSLVPVVASTGLAFELLKLFVGSSEHTSFLLRTHRSHRELTRHRADPSAAALLAAERAIMLVFSFCIGASAFAALSGSR